MRQNRGGAGWPFAAAGLLLFALAVVCPLTMALLRSAAETNVETGSAVWQTVEPINLLMARTLWWAASCATAAALIGWLTGRAMRQSCIFTRVASLVVPLLPPYAVFYALWRLFPPGCWLERVAAEWGNAGLLRQSLLGATLILWGWAVVAWIVCCLGGSGARSQRELLAVDGARWSARFASAWREDRWALLMGWIALTLFFVGDTTAFDVAQVRTIGFELRTLDSLGMAAGQLTQLGAPAIFLVVLGVGAIVLLARRGEARGSGVVSTCAVEPSGFLRGASTNRGASRMVRIANLLVWILAGIVVGALFLLASSLSGASIRSEFVLFDLRAAANSLQLACMAGVLGAVIAVAHFALAAGNRLWRTTGFTLFALWLAVGCVPGTLIALVQLHAWHSSGMSWVVDQASIGTLLGELCRFAFAAALIGTVAGTYFRRDRELQDQIALEPLTFRGYCRLARGTLLILAAVAFAVTATLAAGEVVIAGRLQAPGAELLASSLLNAIHYQDAAGVLLALPMLAGMAVLSALVLALLLRRAVIICAVAGALCLSASACDEQVDQGGTSSAIVAVSESITPERLVPTICFGAAGRVPGRFEYPRAIDISPLTGEMVVIDKAAQVQVFDAAGKLSRFWRMPEWEMGKPTGVTVDAEGFIWVADTHYHRVIRFRPSGEESLRIGEYGQGPGQFIYPTDIAILPQGEVMISEYGGNDRVQVFTKDGQFIREFGSHGSGSAEFIRPQALALSLDSSEVFIADACNHRIQVFGVDGAWRRTISHIGREPGALAYPYSLLVLDDGSLLVSEFGNNRIQRLDARTGESRGMWGGAGHEEGRLLIPWAVARLGTRYAVLDSGNSRVVVIDFPPWDLRR